MALFTTFLLSIAIILISFSEVAAHKGTISLTLLSQESDDVKKQRFDKFKTDNGKSYKDSTEESKRYTIFTANLVAIDERNRLEGAMVHGITKFTDLSSEEFSAMYLTRSQTFKATADELRSIAQPAPEQSKLKLEADTNVDWSALGRTTAIKNQGNCGSCWAFGITEQIESDTIRLLGKTYILAPQQVVDCDTVNLGCNGGNESPALSYVKSAGGICQEADYPYVSGSTGTKGTCKTSVVSSKRVVNLQSYSSIFGEANIASFVTNTGPVTIAVDATNWSSYVGNVMTKASCSSGHTPALNHVVQAVGLFIGSSSGLQSYWKVRNQWGSNWGLSGYIKLEYNTNACLMASDYAYYTTPYALTTTTNSPTATTTVPTISTRVPTVPTASLAPSKSTTVPTGSPSLPKPTNPPVKIANPTVAPSRNPTNFLSQSPSSASSSWSCNPYGIPQNWYRGLAYVPCTMYACPGTKITASSCSSFSGDTYAVLLNSAGIQVADNDDAYSGSKCSSLTYTVPANAVCNSFTLAQSKSIFPLAFNRCHL